MIRSFSESYSPIGPGAGDATRYQVEYVESLFVIQDPSTTETIVSTPTTMTFTLEQGPSRYSMDFPPTTDEVGVENSQIIACDYDLDKGTGSCENVYLEASITTENGVVVTKTAEVGRNFYGGTVAPWTVVTFDANTASATAGDNGVGSGATKGSVRVFGLVAAGLITGTLLTVLG
ncbi:hypothetical protein CPC08DRAFT_473300 [Agrocybe pediades]|nr:hypothetical protein CPC08DRAFT_473300 [Agrocybe pediades]